MIPENVHWMSNKWPQIIANNYGLSILGTCRQVKITQYESVETSGVENRNFPWKYMLICRCI